MTAVAAMLSDRDRRRLARRVAELRDLDRTVRQRGSMPAVPPPTPLHRMGAMRATITDVRAEQPSGEGREPS